jgi:hypothetical protein
MRHAAIASLLVAAFSAAAGAHTPEALFNGRDLRGWRAEHAKARVRESVISMDASRGWVRTERPFTDFVLTLEVRMRDGGRAGIVVRGWPFFDKNDVPARASRERAGLHRAVGCRRPCGVSQHRCPDADQADGQQVSGLRQAGRSRGADPDSGQRGEALLHRGGDGKEDRGHGLDASAMAAAKGWRFKPGTIDGKAARMVVTIELKFTLQ